MIKKTRLAGHLDRANQTLLHALYQLHDTVSRGMSTKATLKMDQMLARDKCLETSARVVNQILTFQPLTE